MKIAKYGSSGGCFRAANMAKSKYPKEWRTDCIIDSLAVI